MYFNNLCFSCLNRAKPGEQAVLLESCSSFIPSRFQWEIKSTASPLLNSDPHCVCYYLSVSVSIETQDIIAQPEHAGEQELRFSEI